MPNLENNTLLIALMLLFAYLASIALVTLGKMRGQKFDAIAKEINLGIGIALAYSILGALLLLAAHAFPLTAPLSITLYLVMPALWVIFTAAKKLGAPRYTFALWFGTLNQVLLFAMFLSIKGILG